MKPRSIRWTLLGWFGALLAFVLIGLNVSAWALVRQNRIQMLDAQLIERVAAVASDLRSLGDPGGPGGPEGPGSRGGGRGAPPPPGGRSGERKAPPEPPGGERRFPEPGGSREDTRSFALPERTADRFFADEGAGFYFVAWSRTNRELGRSGNAPAMTAPEVPPFRGQTQVRTQGEAREAILVTERGDLVLVGSSLAMIGSDLTVLGWQVGLASVAFLLLALGVAWYRITRSLRPLTEISQTARRIAVGNLAERVPDGELTTELTELVGVLNQTFDRLEAAFAELRQFTADASHELRTPITVIIAEVQSALKRSRSEAEYREALETCLESAQDMRRLAESLLTLARLDAGRELGPRRPLDLATLADELCDLMRPIADERRVAIETQLAPAMVLADPGALKQVLMNLLDNAIYYNRPEGRVVVSTAIADGQVVLAVRDTGIGIAESDLPEIFRRFYRADRSRTQAAGRTGLGLAIVRSIVDLHGGSIAVASELGVGSTFTVRLPPAPSN